MLILHIHTYLRAKGVTSYWIYPPPRTCSLYLSFSLFLASCIQLGDCSPSSDERMPNDREITAHLYQFNGAVAHSLWRRIHACLCRSLEALLQLARLYTLRARSLYRGVQEAEVDRGSESARSTRWIVKVRITQAN